MRRPTWLLAAAAVAIVAAIATVLGVSGADKATGGDTGAAPQTANVERGKLSALVEQIGTLTYRAQPDGSPYAVVNQARGTITELPEAGDEVACGGVLYRVDQRPVLLLCGAVPAYRTLRQGEAGRDVRQLNRTLRRLGDAAPASDDFTDRTRRALEALQRRRGLSATGVLDRGDAVFVPGPARVAKVDGKLGGAARPGATVLTVTSSTLHVRVDFDASQQGHVKRGDRAQVTLPGSTTVGGSVVGFGRVADAPAGQDSAATDATVPTYISLDGPAKARRFDRAPVQVQIVTAGVADALSVPVTALVGKAGGGFAVEVIRAGGRRQLVAVKLGLFDTAGGRVQVDGPLRPGDDVVVPSL